LPFQRKAKPGQADVEGLEMISAEEVQLLHDLAAAVEDGCVVEVGSYRGRSTIALSGAVRDHIPVFAIEPHEAFTGVLGGHFGPEDRAGFFRNMLASGAYNNVRLVNLSSEVVTPGWDKPVSLLFLDGDHTYAGVSRDFGCWEPHLAPSATVVFDDSTDETIGPHQLIHELVDSRRAEILRRVGKVTAIRLTSR
jgi:predicted O-methyltransferase YrrM